MQCGGPERPFHNFRASKSGNKRALYVDWNGRVTDVKALKLSKGQAGSSFLGNRGYWVQVSAVVGVTPSLSIDQAMLWAKKSLLAFWVTAWCATSKLLVLDWIKALIIIHFWSILSIPLSWILWLMLLVLLVLKRSSQSSNNPWLLGWPWSLE